MAYPSEDGHPSKYKLGPTWVNFIHAMNAANHHATPPVLMLMGLLLTHSLSGFLAFLYWYLTAYPTRRIRNKNIQNTTNRSFATINDIATACEHYKTAAHYPQDCLAHLIQTNLGGHLQLI